MDAYSAEPPCTLARAEDTRDLFFSACLAVIALLPRLYVAIAWAREPVWDGHYYDFGARRIAAGLGYSDGTTSWHPWCHWPVGYSGFLAAVYRFIDAGPHTAPIANAVTGALLAIFTHRLARRELGLWRARIAGVLVAMSPGLIIYSALLMSEPLSALAIVIAGWVFMRYRGTKPELASALFGLAIGAGTLVHPSFLAYAPAPFFLGEASLLASIRGPALRRSAMLAGISVACALVPVLPWTYRNCRVMDRCTLVSTNGGWNLAIGAFSRATGRFETLRSSDGCAVVTGQVQQDACWRDLALSTIRQDPMRWLGLVPKKLGFTFDHESFAIEYLHEADPDRWPESRRQRGRDFLSGLHRVLLTVALFGLVAGYGRTRRAWAAIALSSAALGGLAIFAWRSDDSPFYLLAIAIGVGGSMALPGSPPRGPVTRWAIFCVLATLLTHAVFFGEDRYHIVVTPMLCLLAAAAFRPRHEATPLAPHTT